MSKMLGNVSSWLYFALLLARIMSKHSTNSKYSRKSLAVATAVLTLLGSMQLASAGASEPVPQEVGSFSANPSNLTAVGDTLYFRANDGTTGSELWKHDSGTTSLVKNIRLGGNSDPDRITAVGDTVYFRANDGTTGSELWKHNSTTTTLVRDINLSGNGDPNPRAVVGDTLYFTANDGTETRLWHTNATTTTQVRDSGNATLQHSGDRIPFKGMLFLKANNGTGDRLWRAGGSPTATASLVTPTNLSTLSDPDDFSVVGDHLYFSAVSAGVGRELWRTDGTDEGTELVRDLNTSGDGSPSQVVAFKGSLYFTAFDSSSLGLWKSDGSPTGTTTRLVPAVGPEPIDPSQLKVAGDYLYFSASSGGVMRQLWRTDGSPGGTVMLRDFPGSVSSNPPSLFTEVGMNLFFAANDGEAGLEVWVSNGFEQGTRIVEDIKPGEFGSNPTTFTPVGNTMYFRAESPVYKLWKSDGTDAGTQQIATTASVGNLTLVESTIFFTSNNKLWRLSTASQSTGNNFPGGTFVTTPAEPLKKIVRMKKLTDKKVSLPARAKRELRSNVRSMTTVTAAVCTGFVSNQRVASFTKKQARERAVRACNIVKRLQPAAEVRTRVVAVDNAKLPRLRSVRVAITGN
jgi:ELWxxDGT repeat protein